LQLKERKRVLEQFAASEAHLLRLIDGLTPEQLAFRGAPDRWSIGETVEHVVVVENAILRTISQRIEQPSTRTERPNPAAMDAALWKHTANRTRRVQAPERARPTGKFTVAVEAVESVRTTRGRTVEFVQTSEGDLRGHVFPHIVFGDLDLYQWLIFLSLHGSRHAEQIEEIRADPGFPKA
jgi:hypothetical protein